MAADVLKSASITGLDALITLLPTTGEGGAGYLRDASDVVAPTAAGLVATTSTYRVVRLPSNAKLKAIDIETTAALETSGSPTLAVDLGAYYSDSLNDGTAANVAGTLISVNAFAAAVVFGGATTEKINGLSAYAVTHRIQPLWLGLGLAADPGGFIDVVLAVHTAATTAAAGNVIVRVSYVD